MPYCAIFLIEDLPENIQRLLMDVREQFEQTIVMVTHDMSLADSVDRKVVMSDGRVL